MKSQLVGGARKAAVLMETRGLLKESKKKQQRKLQGGQSLEWFPVLYLNHIFWDDMFRLGGLKLKELKILHRSEMINFDE